MTILKSVRKLGKVAFAAAKAAEDPPPKEEKAPEEALKPGPWTKAARVMVAPVFAIFAIFGAVAKAAVAGMVTGWKVIK